MLHTKFQASKPCGSEEEDFWIFFYVFLWFEPTTPWRRGHLGPWDLHLNKLGRDPLGNATYQISNIWAKWFWRRRFLNIFLCISMVWTYDPLARGHLGPWDLGLNKLGKGPPGNATHQISSTWAKQFWRRRFWSIFHFWTQNPCRRAISDPRAIIRTNLVEVH